MWEVKEVRCQLNGADVVGFTVLDEGKPICLLWRGEGYAPGKEKEVEEFDKVLKARAIYIQHTPDLVEAALKVIGTTSVENVEALHSALQKMVEGID